MKVYRIDNAKEIILSLFRGGDFFGEMSLIQKGLQRSATAETMDNCSIYTLVRSEFYHFMERTPKLCLRLLEVTMERLRKTNEQIYDLTFLDVRSRIIKTIFRLSEQYGQPKTNGTFINMKLTHQQLANMVGTVRESVTKVLQELQEDHIITIDKKVHLRPRCGRSEKDDSLNKDRPRPGGLWRVLRKRRTLRKKYAFRIRMNTFGNACSAMSSRPIQR